MENKYFTPSIEDIRVGYECYFIKDSTKDIIEDNLVKIVLNNKQASGILYKEPYWELDTNQQPNTSSIRVPYLTREQIEAERWKHVWWEKGVHNWEMPNHILTTFDGGYRIIIDTKGPRRLYDGECKDINTFRYICKLLGI